MFSTIAAFLDFGDGSHGSALVAQGLDVGQGYLRTGRRQQIRIDALLVDAVADHFVIWPAGIEHPLRRYIRQTVLSGNFFEMVVSAGFSATSTTRGSIHRSPDEQQIQATWSSRLAWLHFGAFYCAASAAVFQWLGPQWRRASCNYSS